MNEDHRDEDESTETSRSASAMTQIRELFSKVVARLTAVEQRADASESKLQHLAFEIARVEDELGQERASRRLSEARNEEISDELTLLGQASAQSQEDATRIASSLTDEMDALRESAERLRAESVKLAAELKAERAARQAAEARLDELTRELAFLRQSLEKPRWAEVHRPLHQHRSEPSRSSSSEIPSRPSTPYFVESSEDSTQAALADWGFIPRGKAQTPTPAVARESEPPPELDPSDDDERPTILGPAPTQIELAGLTVLDVLGSDPTLNSGQRETLRMVYARFIPQGEPNPEAQIPDGTTVADVLESDPNLQRGQREALRTMYESFGVHRRQRSE